MIHKLILESWIQIGYFYREGHSSQERSLVCINLKTLVLTVGLFLDVQVLGPLFGKKGSPSRASLNSHFRVSSPDIFQFPPHFRIGNFRKIISFRFCIRSRKFCRGFAKFLFWNFGKNPEFLFFLMLKMKKIDSVKFAKVSWIFKAISRCNC